MKLTIFAATGGIGRHMMEQALAAGHDVTVAVRSPDKVAADVRTVAADLAAPDTTALESAVGGADAVLSGLGPRRPADFGVTAPGTRAIASAMAATGVRRLVVVSAAPIGTVPSPARPNPPRHDPGDGFFTRHLFGPLIKVLLRRHYADLAAMEDLLRASDLDWTVVRPPRLTNGPRTGQYRTAIGQNLRGGTQISRADVADLMLAVLGRADTIGQSVGVAR